MEDVVAMVINGHEIPIEDVIRFKCEPKVRYGSCCGYHVNNTHDMFYNLKIELKNEMTLSGSTDMIDFHIVKQTTKKIRL